MKTLKSLSFIVCLILCSLTYESFSQTNDANAEIQVVNEKKSKPFIGINGGIGAGVHYAKGFYTYTDGYYEYFDYFENYSSYLPASVGVDFAFPIGNVFALGPYASLGGEASSFNVGLGALAMFRFKNECAIMVGEGFNIITDLGLGSSSRIGFKFKKRLYLLGEVNTSSFIYNDPHIETYNVSFLIHVGFKLN